MRKGKMKWMAGILFAMGCLFAGFQTVQAAETTDVQSQLSTPEFYNISMEEESNKTMIFWYIKNYYEKIGTSISYEVEVASDDTFSNGKKMETTEKSMPIEKSEFGAEGGRLYFRVRQCVKPASAAAVYSEWSETKELVHIKISKKNFPGLYQLLKKGGEACSLDGEFRKEIYDKNSDGWLDPEEIQDLTSLSTENHLKKKNGVYSYIPTAKVSSMKGVEYLTKLHDISLVHYSGKKMDLRKNSIKWIDIRGITSKQFTLLAPDAEMIFVEPALKNKMKKLDLSACTSAVDLSAYGNFSTRTLKLPKANKNMKVLSISDIGAKSINLNQYKNLQQFYAYRCELKKLKLNKCKKLRYVYFYYCNKLRSVNLSASKKLRGIDLYHSPGLSIKRIKAPKGTKITLNKGKWWYSTEAYKNDMKNLYTN